MPPKNKDTMWSGWMRFIASKRNVPRRKLERSCPPAEGYRCLAIRGGWCEFGNAGSAVTNIFAVDVTALDANGFEIPVATGMPTTPCRWTRLLNGPYVQRDQNRATTWCRPSRKRCGTPWQVTLSSNG